MDYKQWVDLFGNTTSDKKLQNALAKAGIMETPQIERDETDVSKDIVEEGISLIFTDATLLNRKALIEEPAVLTTVILLLQHPFIKKLYKGSLPFKLKIGDSKESLQNQFGEPVESSEKARWDRWKINNLLLTVIYSKDLRSLNRIVVSLPLLD